MSTFIPNVHDTQSSLELTHGSQGWADGVGISCSFRSQNADFLTPALYQTLSAPPGGAGNESLDLGALSPLSPEEMHIY